MKQEAMKAKENLCIQGEPPYCMASCPVHVDAREMLACLTAGNFEAAYQTLIKKVTFPEIICRICDAPCQKVCKRKEIGDKLAIRDLEKAAVTYGKTSPKTTVLRKREKRIAIVGGGLSGLTAAVELAKKGYQLEIFEESDRLGGRIWEYAGQGLEEEHIEEDFKLLATFPIEVHLNSSVTLEGTAGISLDSLLEEFAAVYFATGQEAALRLIGTIEAETGETGREKLFAGGSLRRAEQGYSPIFALADGRKAAISIDRFLQGVSLTSGRKGENVFTTELFTSTEGIPIESMLKASDVAAGYSEEEAIEEAKRCIQCQCLECVKVCEYLSHYQVNPKSFPREVYNNLSIIMGTRHANEKINACSLCGLCQKVCPKDLNMGEICFEAREEMVLTEKMPISYHDFALKDLAFSNSEAFFLAANPEGSTQSEYLFFPGCQLAASVPQLVTRVYDDLASHLAGGVGILLGCCGVIAHWSGRKEIFKETQKKLEEAWRTLGEPKVIMGCPTCYQVFSENQPQMELLGIWEVLEELGFPEKQSKEDRGTLAIHDTCTTRMNGEIQDSVRRIAQKLGYAIEELPYNRAKTKCCGYGGLMAFVNQDLGKEVVQNIIGESSADYLTYCVNCRDRFAGEGKRTVHLLDLLYQEDLTAGIMRKPPTYSERHSNRIKVKHSFCYKLGQEKQLWSEEVMPKLRFTEEALELMEDRMILAADLSKVIAYAEKTGNKLWDKKAEMFIAYYQLTNVTYWVYYTLAEDTYLVHKAYSHRMTITDEVGGQIRYRGEEEAKIELSCVKCAEALHLDQVTLVYMGNKFPVELPKCSSCGLIFIPEELALGKMLQVEKALEDK